MASINTNSGALVALQTLNTTNSALQTTQNRISTGLKVSSAKDNAAIFSIAQGQRAQISSLDAVKDSLQRGQSVADTAQAAGSTVSDLVTQLKAKALAYSDTSNSADAKTALNNEYKSLYAQIQTVTDNATFDGTNLVAGTASTHTTDAVNALANAQGSATIGVAHVDLSKTGAVSDIPADLSTAGLFTDATTTTATLAKFDTDLGKVNAGLSALGTGSKALDTHLSFIGKLQDSLTTGVGNLVDADVAKESANLTALQTKQQLGIQALSIANSSSSTLLSLFRG